MKTLSFPIFVFLSTLLISTPLLAQDEEYEILKTNEPIKIDGNLEEWADVPGIYTEEWEDNGGTSKGPNDISLTFYLLWSEDALYFAAEVTDDEHLHENTGDSIWNGDSIQVAIDPTGKRPAGGFDGVSYEYNFGLDVEDEVVLSRLFGDPGGWPKHLVDPFSNEGDLAIIRDDDKSKTYYELMIPAKHLAPAEFMADEEIGFGMICNDGDGAAPGQAGWVGWGTQSIVFGKDNSQMNLVIFSKEELAVSPEGKSPDTWGYIKSR